MDDRERRPWRGLPISELTFAIALVMALFALISLGTPRGNWAMAGALVLALLAGAEIRWRGRNRG